MLIGLIYYQIGNDQKATRRGIPPRCCRQSPEAHHSSVRIHAAAAAGQSVQDRTGSLFFIAVQGVFQATMSVITIFGVEKAVFSREYSSGQSPPRTRGEWPAVFLTPSPSFAVPLLCWILLQACTG